MFTACDIMQWYNGIAGLGANFEFDLRRIFALSTLRQLGIMIVTISIGLSGLAFFIWQLVRCLRLYCLCVLGLLFILWAILRIFVLWVVYLLTLQRGVTGTARMLHAPTHSSISRQVRGQM